MKKNGVAFLVIFLVLGLFVTLGILCLKYLDLPLENINRQDELKYGVVSKNYIKSDKILSLSSDNEDDLFVSTIGGKCGIVDINSNVIIDIKYEECSLYNGRAIVKDDKMYYFMNLKGEVMLQSESGIFDVEDPYSDEIYYVVSDDDKNDIYDNDAKYVYTVYSEDLLVIYDEYILLGNEMINYNTDEAYKIENYWGNGNYYVVDLYKDNGYIVFDKKNKVVKNYDEMIETDFHFTFKNTEETLIYDNEGKLLDNEYSRKINDKYTISYSACESGFKVFNNNGESIFDECYTFLNEEFLLEYDYFYMFDENFDGSVIGYPDGKIIRIDYDFAYMVGEFVVARKNEFEVNLYDKNGNIMEDVICDYGLSFIDNGKYNCSDGLYSYVVDSKMNIISDKFEDMQCNDNGACIVMNFDGKYGLMINEEIIIEPSYYFADINNDYVLFENWNGYDVISLDYAGELLTKEELVYKIDFEYGDLVVEDVIKEYGLEEIEEIIFENEELFKKYAYITLTNKDVNGYRKEILLLFNLLVDNKEILDEEYFFMGLNRLSIVLNNDLAGGYAAGIYSHPSRYINLLYDDLSIVNHELMHFMDYNINFGPSSSYIYLCNDEYYSKEEALKLSESERDLCEEKKFDFGNFMIEAGAETNMARYTGSIMRTYNDGVLVYYALSNLFGEEFMEDVYLAKNGDYKLFKKLSNYMTFEEYNKFIDLAIQAVDIYAPYDEQNKIDLFIILSDLYSEVIGGDWYDDEEYRVALSLLLGIIDFDGKISNEDKSHLCDVSQFTNDLVNKVDSKYTSATTEIGMFIKDGKTWFDFTIWDVSTLRYLRVSYDFENEKIVESEIITQG